MNEILTRIKPCQQEIQHFRQVTAEFIRKLNSKLRKARALLGGSGAKDTWLAGNHDVDIFVLFDYQTFSEKSAELSSLLKPVLKRAFPGKRMVKLHGSRDYFQMRYENINFEIIPILKISKASQAKNITDISPLHSRWVNTHTKGLKDEIRLAKQFLRAQRLYGAESYIAGFSGYVVEILIAHYGSLEKLLKASQQWKVKEVIDAENHYPKKDALFQLNKSKTQSPLIVIDPVDKTRNASAALSIEKFLRLKAVAQAYRKKPDAKFFQEGEITLEKMKREAEREKHNLVFISVLPLAGKEDVVGMKLLKTYGFLQGRLKGFGIKKSGWSWDKGKQAAFYFFLEKKELPKVEIRPGPPLALKEHLAGFRKKYQETFVEGGRLMARVPVRNYELKGFVKETVKGEYVKERVKEVKEITVT